MELDLLSFESVVKFAEAWNALSWPLNVLINNVVIFSIGAEEDVAAAMADKAVTHEPEEIESVTTTNESKQLIPTNESSVSSSSFEVLVSIILLWKLIAQVDLVPPSITHLQFSRFLKNGFLLLMRVMAVTFCVTLSASLAARQGSTSMAAFQICLQVWLATSLLPDGLAVAGQAIIVGAFAQKDFERATATASRVLQLGLILGLVLAMSPPSSSSFLPPSCSDCRRYLPFQDDALAHEHFARGRAFFQTPNKDWNRLISSQATLKNDEAILSAFTQMEAQGVCPDSYTLPLVFKACSGLNAVHKGRKLHGRILGSTHLIGDVRVCTASIEFYCKCRFVEEAFQVFDEMRERDLVAWNAMIARYVGCGYVGEAIRLFRMMGKDGFRPNSRTLVQLLLACEGVLELKFGKDIQGYSLRNGYFDVDPHVGTALVGFYMNFDVNVSGLVFDSMDYGCEKFRDLECDDDWISIAGFGCFCSDASAWG
ncbi:Protein DETOXIFICATION 42 [Linum grandiflorum]